MGAFAGRMPSPCSSQAGGQVARRAHDTPVIGYGMKTVNTLRLWQAEPFQAFDFNLFNAQNMPPPYERTPPKISAPCAVPQRRHRQDACASSSSISSPARAGTWCVLTARPMAGISPFCRAHTRYSSTIPTPQWLFPSCCASCWWKRAGMHFCRRRLGWPTIPLPTPTTPLCPRRWKNGIRSCSAACCPVYPYVKLDALLRRTLEQRACPWAGVPLCHPGGRHGAYGAWPSLPPLHQRCGAPALDIGHRSARMELSRAVQQDSVNGAGWRLANPELAALLHDAVGDGG